MPAWKRDSDWHIGASGFLGGSLPLSAEAVERVVTSHVANAGDFVGHGIGCDYPGSRPAGSFVVADGRVWSLEPTADGSGWRIHSEGGAVVDLDDWLASHGFQPVSGRRACLAYGSNLHPPQVRGFTQDDAVIALSAVTVGLAAAYSWTTRARDDQHPAGIAADSPDWCEQHAVLLLTDRQVSKLDGKEGQGSFYSRASIRHPNVPLAAILQNGTAIVGALPVYLQEEASRPLAAQQGELFRLFDWEQARFADMAGEVLTVASGLDFDRLPQLPGLDAAPLPVFAYGTLQPGGTFWPRIHHMAVDVDPAEVRGRVATTPSGFPGLELDPRAPVVTGTALTAAHENYREFLARCDRIEGHPHLYERSVIRLNDGRLAWAYLWKGDRS